MNKFLKTCDKKQVPTIGAFYQCYNQPKAVICALKKFRKVYPDSSIIMISDNGDHMENIAKFFNCNYTHSLQSTSEFSTYLTDENAVKIYVKRMYEAATKIKEDYVLLLANDVHIFKPITNLKYDLNGGKGYWRRDLKRRIMNLFRTNKKTYTKYDDVLAFGDGFVLKKEFILKHFKNIDASLPKLIPMIRKRCNNLLPSDVCINMLTVYYGGTVGPYFGWEEKTRSSYWLRKLLNNIQVLHQEKSLYNLPLSPEERDILNGKY